MLMQLSRTICDARVNAILFRALHSKPQVLHEVKEIEIPVPWGKVAGKLWGSQDKQPILAMHGWQDNAASFDHLAPFIAKHSPVLAIDLPGHGLSSWLPPGHMYMEVVYLLLMKRIKKYFGWEKLKVLAHSLSTMTTYWYAASFPMELQYVVALDFYKFPVIEPSGYVNIFGNAIEAFLKLEQSTGVQPSYSEDEIIKKWMAGITQMDEVGYRTLMTRGVTRKEDGTYTINRDPRLRVAPVHTMFSREQLDAFAELIKCPYLILRGEKSFYAEVKENYYSSLEILRAHNNDVHFERVPGAHHFHLTHAKQAAAVIDPFLKKYDR